MSGHSKWAQIKRQKGVTDVKRGLVFTKLASAITIAVKQGGGIADPNSNFKLRLAVDKAKEVNMPKENIERAIQRAISKQAGNMEEIVYEGFGPLKVAVIVEAVTDNKLRTNAVVKNIFDKEGGVLGQPGSVSYMFRNLGRIIVKKNNRSSDEIFLTAAELGADDIEEGEQEVTLYTEQSNLSGIRTALSDRSFEIESSELYRKPQVTTQLKTESEIQKVIDFLGKLEELDDVQKVYSNLEIKV